jgi:tRNA pseudouridine55 synthase
MNGLVLIDKPPDCTSHDVVLELRRILSEPRVGHFGTLDPMATGLLLAALGKATRLFPFFSREDKTYRGRIRLGVATDTYDAQGKPLVSEGGDLPQESALLRAMSKYEGPLQQLPPAFSAKKYKGQPLYKRARAGNETPRTASSVTVHRFVLLGYQPPDADIEVSCSSGTYIRSLAHDLGRDLGCGGHLTQLRRMVSGQFKVEEAFTLARVGDLAAAGQADRFLIPVEDLLTSYPKAILDESEVRMVRNGQAVPYEPREAPSDIVFSRESSPWADSNALRLFNQDGHLVALAHQDVIKSVWRPFLLFD